MDIRDLLVLIDYWNITTVISGDCSNWMKVLNKNCLYNVLMKKYNDVYLQWLHKLKLPLNTCKMYIFLNYTIKYL